MKAVYLRPVPVVHLNRRGDARYGFAEGDGRAAAREASQQLAAQGGFEMLGHVAHQVRVSAGSWSPRTKRQLGLA